MFQSVRRLSPDVYECWEFAHPRATTSGCDNGHNVRSAEMVFTIPEAGILQYVFLSFSFDVCSQAYDPVDSPVTLKPFYTIPLD